MDRAGALVEETTNIKADVFLRDQELNNLQWIRDLLIKFKGEFDDLTIGLDTWLKQLENSKTDFTQGNQHPSLNALSFAVLVDYEIIKKFSDALMKKENFEKALRLCQIVFAGYEGFFGVEHPKTLEAQLKIASYLFTMQEYAQALDLNRQVYKILQSSNFGPNHELTIIIQLNVASIFMHQNKSAEARQILQDVYPGRIHLKGRDHQECANVKILLEFCMILIEKENKVTKLFCKHVLESSRSDRKQGEALSASLAVVDKTELLLGSDHVKTLQAKRALASTFFTLGQFKIAIEICRIVYDKRKKILGPNHEDTLEAQYSINVSLFHLQEYEEALRENKILHALQAAFLPADHKDTLKTLAQIAYCLESLEKYKEALDVRGILLQKQQSIFGLIHKKTIKTELTIAKVLGKLGECARALEGLQKVYERQVELYGEGHKFTAHTKRILGTGRRQLAVLEGGETLVCSICLATMEFLESLAVFAFQCTHVFHEHCVLPWARGGGTCPECRSSLLHETVEFLINEKHCND